MFALVLLAALAQTADAPLATLDETTLPAAEVHAWLVPMGAPDGGVAVCMDSPTAVADARSLVALRKENDDLKQYALSTDPGWLKVAVIAAVGLLAGGAITAGALSATGHLK